MRNLVSQLCRQCDFSSDEYVRWCELIRERPRHHRKQWEYCYILQALSERDMLRFGRRGLGFGVGREPLAAAMASLGCEIIATDQAADRAAAWIGTDQHATAALNDRALCAAQEFAERVRFQVCDMNAISDELANFDFTWSSCSFEHLGSIRQGIQFLLRQMDCLKPGGVAVHTTEFNVSSNERTIDNAATVLFRQRDIELAIDRLRECAHRISATFDLGDLPLDRHVDVAPYSDDQHLKLRIGEFISTSIGIIIEKSC